MNLPLARTADDTPLDLLVRRMAQRDESALATLYRQTAPRIYGAALRLAGERVMAESAVEDTYWQAWNEADRFDATRGDVMAWLLTLVRSRTLDAMRRERRRSGAAVDLDLLDDTACPRPRPDQVLAQRQQQGLVQGLVDALEPLPRQLLALAFVRGLTHEEIASHAGLPTGTVKSHIRRALGQLRVRLQRRGIEPGD